MLRSSHSIGFQCAIQCGPQTAERHNPARKYFAVHKQSRRTIDPKRLSHAHGLLYSLIILGIDAGLEVVGIKLVVCALLRCDSVQCDKALIERLLRVDRALIAMNLVDKTPESVGVLGGKAVSVYGGMNCPRMVGQRKVLVDEGHSIAIFIQDLRE